MNVRSAQQRDIDAWTAMRLALWPDADFDALRDETRRFFREGPMPGLQAAFVCETDSGELCGMAEVSIHTKAPGCETDRIGYLEAWFVAEGWRGKGIGRALVTRAETWAREKGCTEMASDTTPDYPVSPAAHGALGYAETARYFRKNL